MAACQRELVAVWKEVGPSLSPRRSTHPASCLMSVLRGTQRMVDGGVVVVQNKEDVGELWPIVAGGSLLLDMEQRRCNGRRNGGGGSPGRGPTGPWSLLPRCRHTKLLFLPPPSKLLADLLRRCRRARRRPTTISSSSDCPCASSCRQDRRMGREIRKNILFSLTCGSHVFFFATLAPHWPKPPSILPWDRM